MCAAMASALVSADQDRGARQRYRGFLDAVAASGTLWAVWRGDTWATADDPSGRNSALFLLWSNQESAEASLHASRAAFPGAAEVDRIALDKWLEAYTPELIERSASPFIEPDERLRGTVVDPADLARDLRQRRQGMSLQASDLNRLRRKRT